MYRNRLVLYGQKVPISLCTWSHTDLIVGCEPRPVRALPRASVYPWRSLQNPFP